MNLFKTLLLSITFGLFASTSFAQSTDVSIDFSANGLTVNEIPIMNFTTMDILKKSLGEPSKSVDYPSGETGKFYDDLGIVIFTLDNVVKGVGVNLNWDEDEKFPEQSLKGELLIGGTAIGKDATSETCSSIEELEFNCPVPSICVAANRTETIKCMVAFAEDIITQVVFFMD